MKFSFWSFGNQEQFVLLGFSGYPASATCTFRIAIGSERTLTVQYVVQMSCHLDPDGETRNLGLLRNSFAQNMC